MRLKQSSYNLAHCFHYDEHKAPIAPWLLCYNLNQKHLFTGSRKNIHQVSGCCKVLLNSTRFHQLAQAEKSSHKPREQSPWGNIWDFFRLKLPNAACAILIEVSHSSSTHRAPRHIMNLSRLRTFDTESVTDQITSLSYFWKHGDLILAFLCAHLEEDSQGCQHAEVMGDALLRGWHSLRKNSWDPKMQTT